MNKEIISTKNLYLKSNIVKSRDERNKKKSITKNFVSLSSKIKNVYIYIYIVIKLKTKLRPIL